MIKPNEGHWLAMIGELKVNIPSPSYVSRNFHIFEEWRNVDTSKDSRKINVGVSTWANTPRGDYMTSRDESIIKFLNKGKMNFREVYYELKDAGKLTYKEKTMTERGFRLACNTLISRNSFLKYPSKGEKKVDAFARLYKKGMKLANIARRLEISINNASVLQSRYKEKMSRSGIKSSKKSIIENFN